jgi:5,10-methylenetetrahydrofolate reductase
MTALALSLAYVASLALAGWVLYLRRDAQSLAASIEAKVAAGLAAAVTQMNANTAAVEDIRNRVGTLEVARGIKREGTRA